MAVIAAVVTTEPRWPSRDRAGVPPALEAILRRAMAKERVNRYPTAEALGVDLERFLRGELTPHRRSRALIALGALLVVGLAVAGAAFAWRPAPKEPAPVNALPPPPPPPAPAKRTSERWGKIQEALKIPDRSFTIPLADYSASREKAPLRTSGSAEVAFVDTHRLVVLSLSKPAVRLVDLEDETRDGDLARLAEDEFPEGLSVAPLRDGARRIAFASGRNLYVTTCRDGRLDAKGALEPAAKFPDGRVAGDPRRPSVVASAWSPDGRHVAFSGDYRVIALYAVDERGGLALERTLDGEFTARVSCLAFTRTNKLVSGTWAENQRGGSADAIPLGRTTVWDLATGQRDPAIKEHSGFVAQALGVHPTRDIVALGAHGLFVLWDDGTGFQRSERADGETEQIAFAPSGALYIATGDRGWPTEDTRLNVVRFDAADIAGLKEVRQIANRTPNHVRSLAVSPDGAFLVAAFRDRDDKRSWLEVFRAGD
jgi:hypothetical protein